MLFLLVILEKELLVDWDKEELEAISALSFLLRMLASLELFQLYKVEENEGRRRYIYLEIAYPQGNSSIVQIFPTSSPLESFLRRYPQGRVEQFLEEVREGKNLGIQSMDLGEQYRKNFNYPLLLISWGFPSPVPEPSWNGISLLITTGEKGVKVLEEVITLLDQEPSAHLETLAL